VAPAVADSRCGARDYLTGICKTDHAMAEITRRSALSGGLVVVGLAVGAAAGLTRSIHHRVAVAPPPPPAALTDALHGQQSLLAGYGMVQAESGSPKLASLRADISAHGDAINALLQLYPGWRLAAGQPSTPAAPATPSSTSASTQPAPVPETVQALATASTGLSRSLAAAALSWPSAEVNAQTVVPTLASISACLATHAQVLG
jgi:hypothetical protein